MAMQKRPVTNNGSIRWLYSKLSTRDEQVKKHNEAGHIKT